MKRSTKPRERLRSTLKNVMLNLHLRKQKNALLQVCKIPIKKKEKKKKDQSTVQVDHVVSLLNASLSCIINTVSHSPL